MFLAEFREYQLLHSKLNCSNSLARAGVGAMPIQGQGALFDTLEAAI